MLEERYGRVLSGNRTVEMLQKHVWEATYYS